MLKVNGARWGHSKDLLREEALKAEHTRTRERLMALYEISEGIHCNSSCQRNQTKSRNSYDMGASL